MPSTPPIAARAQRLQKQKMQSGTILSFTTLAHPPSPFDHTPRTIALIELDNHQKVMASVTGIPAIGATVRPRMRLSHVTAEKLRIYDISYEITANVREPQPIHEFPGYILALSGPSGVGKTAVHSLLLHLCKDYVRSVPIMTTRPRERSERGEYRHISKKKFSDLLSKQEIVAIAEVIIDNEKYWEGYRAADIGKIWKAHKIPMVATQTHLLQGLASHYGRRSILSFGLLPPGKSRRTMLSHLLRRLRKQGHQTEDYLQSCLQKAEKDLQFLRERKDLFDRIFVNEDVHMVVEMVRKQVPELAGI